MAFAWRARGLSLDFDPLRTLGDDFHDHASVHQVYIPISGGFVLNVEGQSRVLRLRCWAVMPAGTRHRTYFEDDVRTMLLNFDSGFIERILSQRAGRLEQPAMTFRHACRACRSTGRSVDWHNGDSPLALRLAIQEIIRKFVQENTVLRGIPDDAAQGGRSPMKRNMWINFVACAITLVGVGIGTQSSAGTSSRHIQQLSGRNFATTIQLSAIKEKGNGSMTSISVTGVRFVVVDASGSVLGARTGNGNLRITVAPNGFWDSANKNGMPIGTIASVEILAYAPHMVDTIVLDVPLSNAPIASNEVRVPMMNMVNPRGRNTPNEPNIVFGVRDSLHHLVIDGVSQYYSKFAHIQSSFLRNKQ